MSFISEAISRGWENFLARPDGMMNFRFILQPAAVIFLAIRAGIKDAKTGTPPFLWTVFKSVNAKDYIKRAWKEIRLPFFVSIILDAVYQVVIHHFVYPVEMLFTATLLVIIPYVVLRGPVNRIVRGFIKKKKK